MDKSLKNRISKNRKLLSNPYAFLNGEGGFDAIAPQIELPLDNQVSEERKILQNPYAYLGDDGEFYIEQGASFDSNENEFRLSREVTQKITLKPTQANISFSLIEQTVKKLQQEIWKSRSLIFSDEPEPHPLRLLDPSIAICAVGYDYFLRDSLGQYPLNGRMMEVAGTIDSSSKKIQISRQFPVNTQRFTAAHELGHAILHGERSLHRDRPLDGSPVSGLRDIVEMQADKFASFFLMPEKLVRTSFMQVYYTDSFKLDENALFALGSDVSSKLKQNSIDSRDLARILARIESYNGHHFNSLSKQFGVSVEAMAIRLEELGLLSV